MQEFVIEYIVWVLLALFVAVPAIITFAVRGRITHWFNKDLKKYEQQLDLLKMKKQLQYSNVYTKRAEVIIEIYDSVILNIEMTKNLNDLLFHYAEDGYQDHNSFEFIMAGIKKNQSLLKGFVDKNRLYFSANVIVDIDDIVGEMRKVVECYEDYKENNSEQISPEQFIINSYNKEDLLENFNKLRLSLENTFRELIGVETE